MREQASSLEQECGRWRLDVENVRREAAQQQEKAKEAEETHKQLRDDYQKAQELLINQELQVTSQNHELTELKAQLDELVHGYNKDRKTIKELNKELAFTKSQLSAQEERHKTALQDVRQELILAKEKEQQSMEILRSKDEEITRLRNQIQQNQQTLVDERHQFEQALKEEQEQHDKLNSSSRHLGNRKAVQK